MSEKIVLDFLTANFTDFYLTIHHLNDEIACISLILFGGIVLMLIAYAYENIKKYPKLT